MIPTVDSNTFLPETLLVVERFISSELSDAKPITHQDEQEFYVLAGSHIKRTGAKDFEFNWPYIMQATRGRGYKIVKDNSALHFYIRISEANKIQLVIVSFLGPEFIQLLQMLTERPAPPWKEVLVKNVPIEDLSYWNAAGFIETTQPWNQYSFRDDNTYPQTFSRTSSIAQLEKSAVNRTTRRIINKWQARGITVIPYSGIFKRQAYELLEMYTLYQTQKGTDSAKNVWDAHIFMFDESIRNCFRLAHVKNDSLISVTYLTPVNDCLYFNAMVNVVETNIMRFLAWQAVSYLQGEVGNLPEWLAWQGSEKSGQHSWKGYFYPAIEVEKTHVAKCTF